MPKTISPIRVELTDEQQAAIAPLMEAVAASNAAGHVGAMVVAQVYVDDMRVAFLTHKAARALIRATGRDPDKVKLSSNARSKPKPLVLPD